MPQVQIDIQARAAQVAKIDNLSLKQAIESLLILYINRKVRIPSHPPKIELDKYCGSCKTVKLLHQFARAKHKPLGRQSVCKSCQKEYRDS